MKPPVVHLPFDASSSGVVQPPSGGLRPPQRGRALPRALALALPMVAAACGGVEEYPQTAMSPRSDYAIAIDQLQDLTIVLGVVVGVIVFALLGYIMIRFRHRPGAGEPEQVHGNTQLELAWTLLPAVILAVIAVPTVQTIFATQAEPPENALTINVTGWQWWWEFEYPMGGDTIVTANEVHVPVGRPVHLQMTGGDVIHSFWIPQMGGKRDVIPNRTNHIVFTPLEPGVYLGQCAEFCGDSHALMKMRLIAHTPENFQTWLEQQALPAVEPADSAVLFGQQLFTQSGCAGCHTIEGTSANFGVTGPNLTHFASRRTLAAGILENNAENLAAWLRDPPAIKPGSLMPDLGLSEQEINYLVAYLQTLY